MSDLVRSGHSLKAGSSVLLLKWHHGLVGALKRKFLSSRTVSRELCGVTSSRGEQRTYEQSRLWNEIPEQARHIKPFRQEEKLVLFQVTSSPRRMQRKLRPKFLSPMFP